MKIDISREIIFRTARSGGKGGQNVNKVETMVEGLFNLEESDILDSHQKEILRGKLKNKINAEGLLIVKSQRERSQLANKQDVVKKMNEMISEALKKKKIRIATAPSRGSKEKRIKGKKINAEIKSGRRKISPDE